MRSLKLVLLAIVLIPVICKATTIPLVETTEGKVFFDVVVEERYDNACKITHKYGTDYLFYRNLSDDALSSLGCYVRAHTRYPPPPRRQQPTRTPVNKDYNWNYETQQFEPTRPQTGTSARRETADSTARSQNFGVSRYLQRLRDQLSKIRPPNLKTPMSVIAGIFAIWLACSALYSLFFAARVVLGLHRISPEFTAEYGRRMVLIQIVKGVIAYSILSYLFG
jgi:hypothetical protein